MTEFDLDALEARLRQAMPTAWSFNGDLLAELADELPAFIAELRQLREQVDSDTCSDYCVAEIGRLNEEALQSQAEIDRLREQRDKVLALLDSLDEFGRVISADSTPYVGVVSVSSDQIRAIFGVSGSAQEQTEETRS